jgi:hypothetical protein
MWARCSMTCNDVGCQRVSLWSSPIFLVRKKNADLCFYIYYSKLNSVTRKDCFPLHWIDNTLDTLAGAKWFSTLDLNEHLLEGGSASRLQIEDCFLNWSGAVAVHSHGLWPLQRSSNVWMVNFDHLKRPNLWVMSHVPGRHDYDRQHVPRAPAQPVVSVPAVSKSLPEAQSGEVPTFF